MSPIHAAELFQGSSPLIQNVLRQGSQSSLFSSKASEVPTSILAILIPNSYPCSVSHRTNLHRVHRLNPKASNDIESNGVCSISRTHCLHRTGSCSNTKRVRHERVHQGPTGAGVRRSNGPRICLSPTGARMTCFVQTNDSGQTHRLFI